MVDIFRTKQFAQIYAAKLGIKEELLNRFLWGDFYLDPKTKRVVGSKGLKGRNLKPLFVQFVLDNLWAVYDAVMNSRYGPGNGSSTPRMRWYLIILQCKREGESRKDRQGFIHQNPPPRHEIERQPISSANHHGSMAPPIIFGPPYRR